MGNGHDGLCPFRKEVRFMLTIPKAVVPDQFNVATAFLDRNVAEGRGSKTAIYFEGNSYTYAQVAELANRAGNGLLDLGVDLEQRVPCFYSTHRSSPLL